MTTPPLQPHPPSVPQTCLQRHTAPWPPGPALSWHTRPWLESQTWRWLQGSPSRRAHTRQQLQPSSTRGTPGGHWGGGQGQVHGIGHSWAHTCRDRDPTQPWSFQVASETLTTGYLSARLGSVGVHTLAPESHRPALEPWHSCGTLCRHERGLWTRVLVPTLSLIS